jgi:hypothetical protein
VPLRSSEGAHPDGGFNCHPGSAPNTPYRTSESRGSTDRLDGLKIDRAGLPLGRLADVVAQALSDGRGNILVPLDGILVECEIVSAGFLLDLAVALDRVE